MFSISNLYTRCDNLTSDTYFNVVDIITKELLSTGSFWSMPSEFRDYEVLQFELGTKNDVTILSIRPEALDIYEQRKEYSRKS